MRTFLLVKAALLPLPVYLLGVWLGWPLAGTLAGLAWSAGWSIAARGLKPPPPFELALGLALASIAGIHLAAPDLAPHSHAILLGALAAGAGLSVVLRRPWTSEFSAGQFAGASSSPLFQAINKAISGLWAVLFAWLAAAAFLKLPAAASWGPVALGAIASVMGPKILVRRGLERMAAGDQRNAWTPASFSTRPAPAAATDEVCDVAVVGAGLGGLTAAALLADAGLKVAVFEQHNVPGGFAHTWLRRARTRDPVSGAPLVFRFDSGVHDVSGWYPGGTVHSVFARLGIENDAQWRRLDHRYVHDGHIVDVPRDWRAYAETLAKLYPHEAAQIRALFADIHTVFQGMFSTASERGGIPGAPSTPERLLAYAQANPLTVAWLNRPWKEFVARHVKDPRAAAWFSALGGYVTDEPGKATVGSMVPLFGYYFHGGHYPVGGSGVVAESLAKAIERRGGVVHLKTAVERVLVENGAAAGLMVRDDKRQQRRVLAGAVVCNADVGRLLGSLLDGTPVKSQLEAQAGPMRPACSAFGVSLGLRGSLDMPAVIHIAAPEGYAGMVIPSVADSTCAPEGYSAIEILRLVTNEEARTWLPEGIECDPARLAEYRRSDAYIARKQAAGDALIARARLVIPDIDQRIVFRTDASPATYHRYSWTSAGAIYGTNADGKIPVKTPLRNLVLAGAATHGPGVEAVVISGAYAADALRPGLLASAGRTPAALAA